MIEYTVSINGYGGTSVVNITTARMESEPPTELVAAPGTFPSTEGKEGDYDKIAQWLWLHGIAESGPNAIISGRRYGCRVRTNATGTTLMRTGVPR